MLVEAPMKGFEEKPDYTDMRIALAHLLLALTSLHPEANESVAAKYPLSTIEQPHPHLFRIELGFHVEHSLQHQAAAVRYRE